MASEASSAPEQVDAAMGGARKMVDVREPSIRAPRPYLRRRLMCAGVAWLVAAGCDGRGDPVPVALAGIDRVSYTGCVDRSDRRAGLVLWLIDEPDGATPGRNLPTDQSTSAQGPWIGTRQLDLAGDLTAALADHIGQRVAVTGTLDAQVGTVGRTDQVQNAEGVTFRKLTVSGFDVVPGGCAFDPRRRGTPPPGDPDLK